MAQPRLIPIETGRTARPVVSEAYARLLGELAKARGRAEPGQTCAYNQNRECFVGLQVVAGDFQPSALKDWLTTLSPNSGTGVWMMPFRGIVAADVSAPLDLLYLDSDGRVLDAVEFFPTFRVSPSSAPAASVLALPSHSIFASQTQRGDRLTLCSLDEMQWRLEQATQQGTPPELVRMQPAGAASYPASGPIPLRPAQSSPVPFSPAPLSPVASGEETWKPTGPVLVRDEARPALSSQASEPVREPVREEPRSSYRPAVPAAREYAAPSAAVQPPPAPAQPPAAAQYAPAPYAVAQYAVVEPAAKAQSEVARPESGRPESAKPESARPESGRPESGRPESAKPGSAKPEPAKRSWLSRLLTPDPVDPRRGAPRQAVRGLVAHFFTGGAPQANEVRDMSPTGLYVVTSERWYPGTVIRMTLTRADGGEHPTERSITVHAQSMRWGNDGVGLQFLLEPRKSKNAPAGFADQEQLMAFLKRLG